MAGKKKSKNNLYFLSQYKNNLKIYINFVGQYIMLDFSLGSNLSNVQSFNKSLKERNKQTMLFLLGL